MYLFFFILGFFFAGGFAFWRYRYMRKMITRMQDEIDRAAEENDIVLDFMHKIVGDVASGVDKDMLYRRILRAVTLGCGATSAAIYEPLDGNKIVAVAVEGAFPPQRHIPPAAMGQMESRTDLLAKVLRGEELELHEGLIGEVAASREPVFIRDATKSARVPSHKDATLKITSIIAVPLLFRDDLFGVLAIANPIGGTSFSDMDFSVARSISDQAALSIFNINALNELVEKNKMDYDLKLASSVQRYLLPKNLPSVDGYEFAVKYIPQQKIGGDFYDAFTLPDGKIGIVIGDVSGKGIAAAIIMGQCQTNLRYIAQKYDRPSDVLKMLNREMVVSMRTDMFITMVYAILDPKTGRITLARAGHEKPLVYDRENRSAYFIKSKGIAVGMVAPNIFDVAISDMSEIFRAGDFLVLYTDGITESSNPEGEEFTTERLREILEKSSDLSSEDLCEKITSKVFAFTKHDILVDDDFTLLTLKRTK